MPMLLLDSRSAISGSNQVVNTWHVMCSAQPTVTETNGVVSAINGFYNALVAYRTNASTTVTGSRVLYADQAWWVKPTFDANHKVLTKGYWSTEPLIIGATPSTSSSGTGGVTIPPQLASVVSWRTAVSGRSGRGRTYLGNLGTSAMNQNLIAGAMTTAANAAAAALLTAVTAVSGSGGPYYVAVWSPTKGLIRPILSGVQDNVFDTMRSRVK